MDFNFLLCAWRIENDYCYVKYQGFHWLGCFSANCVKGYSFCLVRNSLYPFTSNLNMTACKSSLKKKCKMPWKFYAFYGFQILFSIGITMKINASLWLGHNEVRFNPSLSKVRISWPLPSPKICKTRPLLFITTTSTAISKSYLTRWVQQHGSYNVIISYHKSCLYSKH